MSEFIVVTWAARDGRLQEHDGSVARLLAYWRVNATRFGLRSLRYFVQAIGGQPFSYGHVMIYEFASLADWEQFEAQMADDRAAGALKEALFADIELGTRRVVEWQDKLREQWFE